MQTYRLCLVGESDGVIYAIKEYEAETALSAAAMAEQLMPEASIWGEQRLRKELSVRSR